MKTNAIKHYISSTLPHIWSVNETKSSSPVASRVFLPRYNIFESPALPTPSRSSKWGVIAAVRRDLHCQRVSVPDTLAGRVIALDVAIPTISARGFTLLYVFSLSMPRGTLVVHSQLLSNSGVCWVSSAAKLRLTRGCVIGDSNLTLHSIESSAARPSPNSTPFLDFLRQTNGQDLWLTREDRSALTHYMYSQGASRSIFDHVAHSISAVTDRSIDVPPVYISLTDYRPISATLMLSQPGLGHADFQEHPSPP